ncbi:MAG: hypothetical protein AWU57_474 [Marinobacter sp. T13-3]|nr:MAG: hypothetical protein AWU57_474 [Marinobacter sp. T13-3]
MTAPHFTVTDNLKDRLLADLKDNGHHQAASAIEADHPDTLWPEDARPTGGGCQAYFVELTMANGNYLLVVWTDQTGCDLPTDEHYLAMVYEGLQIEEDALATLDSENEVAA